jgi:hypothetical protein
MKKFISKSLILMFGLGIAVAFSACHTEEGNSGQKQEEKVLPKHSISGLILKADGTALNGAKVKINGANVSVTGNTFTYGNLSDGDYTIVVECTNYKSAEETVTLSLKTVNDNVVAEAVEKTFYLAENVETQAVKLGGEAQTGDEITIETTSHTDDEGEDVSSSDENINVNAQTPAITGDDYTNINNQISEQSNGQESIEDFEVTLTNITSLEDAQAVARANRIAESRKTRATTAMPNGNELLAGVGVNVGPYIIEFPSGLSFDVVITMPDDVKSAIQLFRTYTGDAWTRVDMNNPGDGILSIDATQPNQIIIKLSTLRTQSFGFGVRVQEEEGKSTQISVTANPVTNNTASTVSLKSMTYKVLSGVVLKNNQNSASALTDFLRKMMIRKYGTRIVKSAKEVTKTYTFTPAEKLHPYGTMYLQGWQTVTEKKYSIIDSNAGFTATEYGDATVFPYQIWTEIEPTHGGGSND